MATVTITTGDCIFCDADPTFEVDQAMGARIFAWQHSDPADRPHIQAVLGDLDPAYREQLINGTHPNCWTRFIRSVPEKADA